MIKKSRIIHKITDKFIDLVLASKSVARAGILNELNLSFIQDPTNIDESKYTADSPEHLVNILAYEKSQVARDTHKNKLILTADTLVLCDGKIFGKAHDISHAKKILLELCGNTHTVITGMVLYDSLNDTMIKKNIKTTVVFHEVEEKRIDART